MSPMGPGCVKTRLRLVLGLLQHDFRDAQFTKILISLKPKFLRSGHELHQYGLLAFLHSLGQSEKSGSPHAISVVRLPADMFSQIADITD